MARLLLSFLAIPVFATLGACDELCEEFCEKDPDPPTPSPTAPSGLDGAWSGTLPNGLIMSLRLLRGRVVGVGYAVDTVGFYSATYDGTFETEGGNFRAEIRAYGPDEASSRYVRQGTFFATGTAREDVSITFTFSDLSGVDRLIELTPYTDARFPFDGPASLMLVEGLWSHPPNGNPVESLHMESDGSLFGQNANGCTYSGAGTVIDEDYNLYRVELEASMCKTPNVNGRYDGYALLSQPPEGGTEEELLLLIFGGLADAAGRDLAMVTTYKRSVAQGPNGRLPPASM